MGQHRAIGFDTIEINLVYTVVCILKTLMLLSYNFSEDINDKALESEKELVNHIDTDDVTFTTAQLETIAAYKIL